jgi:ribosomal protein L21E
VTKVNLMSEVWRQKHEGKTGKVTAVDINDSGGQDFYVVTFKGRTGGVAGFTGDELEAA